MMHNATKRLLKEQDGLPEEEADKVDANMIFFKSLAKVKSNAMELHDKMTQRERFKNVQSKIS